MKIFSIALAALTAGLAPVAKAASAPSFSKVPVIVLENADYSAPASSAIDGVWGNR